MADQAGPSDELELAAMMAILLPARWDGRALRLELWDELAQGLQSGDKSDELAPLEQWHLEERSQSDERGLPQGRSDEPALPVQARHSAAARPERSDAQDNRAQATLAAVVPQGRSDDSDSQAMAKYLEALRLRLR
jgi:hypothetical protein